MFCYYGFILYIHKEKINFLKEKFTFYTYENIGNFSNIYFFCKGLYHYICFNPSNLSSDMLRFMFCVVILVSFFIFIKKKNFIFYTYENIGNFSNIYFFFNGLYYYICFNPSNFYFDMLEFMLCFVILVSFFIFIKKKEVFNKKISFLHLWKYWKFHYHTFLFQGIVLLFLFQSIKSLFIYI